MISRHMRIKREVVEQRALFDLPRSHHRLSPCLSGRLNQRTVALSTAEFFNTIGAKRPFAEAASDPVLTCGDVRCALRVVKADSPRKRARPSARSPKTRARLLLFCGAAFCPSDEFPGDGFAEFNAGLIVHLVVDPSPNSGIACLLANPTDELRTGRE